MRAHTVGINQAVPSQRVKLGADCIKPFNISHFFPLLSAVQEREGLDEKNGSCYWSCDARNQRRTSISSQRRPVIIKTEGVIEELKIVGGRICTPRNDCNRKNFLRLVSSVSIDRLCHRSKTETPGVSYVSLVGRSLKYISLSLSLLFCRRQRNEVAQGWNRLQGNNSLVTVSSGCFALFT